MSEPPNAEVAVFAAALELPADQRGAFLDQACAGNAELRRQVEALLQDHEAAGSFFDKLGQTPQAALREGAIPVEKPGDRIGRYKLLQQIGEGGCGVVYMAEQEEPVRRRVALKVIKLGMDTKQVIARFEAERQALALMDHPNIARVLDAGATETGRPYFVMELVRGVKITDYCDQYNLSTRERLNLFIQVCRAIQHAHQKGIIHRDIKPSNILVTLNDGVPLPKVIDFGIAKATQGKLTDQTLFTAFEQFIGTPAYMSPEQAETSAQDVDTRSDIYSLGVLLYELLTGQTPFDSKELLRAGLDEIRRTIREKEPARPSTRLSTMQGADLSALAKNRNVESPGLIHLVRGDLDWIAMKALEKDRTRRYETANGLALDIERHLKNEPIVARPPSGTYRFQKLVRRNRLAFAAAALMAAVLLAASGISTWQAVRANREARRALQAEALAQQRLVESQANEALATQRLADSEAISKFLTEVFQSPDPTRDGRTITVAETLDKAAKTLETDLTNQPARRCKLEATLGATYYALGLRPEAIILQEKVRDYYLAAAGPEDPDTLWAIHNLASSYYDVFRHDEALKLRKQVLPLLTKVLGPEHPRTLSAMNNLAYSYADYAEHREESLTLRQQLLALRRKVNGPEHPNTLLAMEDLGDYYAQAGRLDDAVKLWEDALVISRKVNGPEHPDTLFLMNTLADGYFGAGQPDKALNLREQALAPSRKVLGPEHPFTRAVMNHLVESYFAAGRIRDAVTLLEESVRSNPKDTEASLTLAIWQTSCGQDADYEVTRRRLLQQAEGTDQPVTAERAAKVACLRPSTNAALLTNALNLAQRAVELGKKDQYLPFYQLALGLAEYRNAQYAAAEQTLTVAGETVGDHHDLGIDNRSEIQGTARLFRAMSLFKQDKLDEARKLFSQAEAEMPPLPKDESKPIVEGKPFDRDLIVRWLAYKEAKALIEGP